MERLGAPRGWGIFNILQVNPEQAQTIYGQHSNIET